MRALSDLLIGALSLAIVVLASVAIIGGGAHAEPVNPATATSEWASPLYATDSWCTSVAQVAVDLTALAPVRMTAKEKSLTRYMKATHADLTDTAIPVCLAYGSTGLGTALTCDPSTTPLSTGSMLTAYGTSETVLVSRLADGTFPPYYAYAQSGTVLVCLTVGF